MLRAGLMAGVLLLGVSSLPAGAVDDVPAPAATNRQAFMRVFAPTQPPIGFTALCLRSPDLCRGNLGQTPRVALTPERMEELRQVNEIANRTVRPVSDLELYGISEYWTLPGNRGDCEDFALLKQRLLMERGWPMGALLLTVVRDENRQGHAVLTVRTSGGDFLLDNRFDEVKRWYEAPYDYVKRQSSLNPANWVALVPLERSSPGQMASAEPN
jgi:predicted transglutaminase-like cysteine proteinase